MKLTRGHYSVKALLDLSLQAQYGPVSVKDRNSPRYSRSYLEKLLVKCARWVSRIDSRRSRRLQTGAACTISLGQILEAVGETIEPLRHTAPAQAEDWVTFTCYGYKRNLKKRCTL